MFCPYAQTECKEQKCRFWEDNNCLMISQCHFIRQRWEEELKAKENTLEQDKILVQKFLPILTRLAQSYIGFPQDLKEQMPDELRKQIEDILEKFKED